MARFQPQVESFESRELLSANNIFAVGTGEGANPRVAVFDLLTSNRIADFAPYEPTFTGGVTTAMGDINADGVADLVVGAGPGGGPRIRIFDGRTLIALGASFSPNAPGAIIADFFAYESTQRGGVFVATGTFSGFVNDEVVVGAGPGGGPRVRILDGGRITVQGQANYTSEALGDTVANFFAFESTFRNGVTVAASQGVNTFSNLTVAPGFGGSPRVRLLSGFAIATQTLAFTGIGPTDTLADFFAFSSAQRSGAFVASADINNDGQFDIVVGTGKDTQGVVRVFNGINVQTQGINFTGNQVGDILDEFSPAGTSYTNGVTVGSAFNNGGGDIILVGVGDAGIVNQTIAFRYIGGSGFLQRQQVLSVTVDNNFRGRPNPSN